MSRNKMKIADTRLLVSVTVILLLLGLMIPNDSYAYDAVASTRKICSHGGVMCSQPYPAVACIGGIPPSGDCVCYTDFTIHFQQTVHVNATNLDKDCGGGRSGFFIIRNTDWSEAYAWDMGDPAFGWSDDVVINPGTYRLEPSAQWGGTYSVDYWSGPADCSGSLNMSNTDFGDEDLGDCSSWRDVTFENNGNLTFTIGAITSSDPAFQIDATGIPGTLDPGDDFDFEVRFCAPGGLTTDTPMSSIITVNYTCNSAPNSRQLTVFGTAHVERGELSVASSFYVGEADWTLPTNWVERNLSISNIGDASMSVTAVITNDAGGVFSLPSGGNVGSISGGSSRNLTIRATVTAETGYTGQLRVEADYGGGFSASEYVELTATGHHPVPILYLYTPEIDYGEVEQDYYFHQAVKIGNTGDAPLTFEISLQDPADPDISEFDLDLGMKGPINGGDFRLYEMTFHPTSNGFKEIYLTVDNTNEEPSSTTHVVRLFGTGTDPIPLSTMLVIDRSGSMTGMAGDVNKISAASDAGILYTNIVRDAWDWLGITKYNESSSTPVHLDAISTNLAGAQGVLNDIGPGGELEPDGNTCIGCGMQTAANEYSVSPPENALSMILLTDGKENEHPFIDAVKPGILATYPNLHIFCVGIGNPIETGPGGIDGIETSKLQAIAEDTDALFRVIQSISGEHRYDLEAFYFKSFAKATERQIVLDPLYLNPIPSTTVPVSSVGIVSCDRDADFLVISELFKIPGMDTLIVLQDPTGQFIDIGSTVGGISVHVKTWANCKLFRVKFPARIMSSHYAGSWRLFLKPLPEEVIPTLAKLTHVPTTPQYLPLAFMVAVGSDYRLKAYLTPGEILLGETLYITAEPTEAWYQAPSAIVTADITQPNGSTITKQLFDDGLHGDGDADDGIYSASFVGTIKGYHEFFIRSIGTTERGESVVREANLSKYIGQYPTDGMDGRPCIPCWLLRLIIIVIIILLLLILFYLIYCCRRQLKAMG